MRWGLIVRSETDRGLGIQTLAMYEHLKPDATLIVDVPKSGFRTHVENYGPEAWKVTFEDDLPEDVVREWMTGLDAIVSVETLYDWRIVKWAKEMGVKTIVHGNPEFWQEKLPQPSTWWWPSTWRPNDHMPIGRYVRVPVPDRPFTAADPSESIQFVHVTGNGAMGDRAGTEVVNMAAKALHPDATLTCFSQVPTVPLPKGRRQGQMVQRGPVEDRWEMYAGMHVLVAPRRYGGLSLPTQEALACGLAVIMPDISPNRNWPIIPVNGLLSKTLMMPTGPVHTYEVYANSLRQAMEMLTVNPDILSAAMSRSREWAEENRWSVLAQTYYDEIERCVST